MRLMRLLGLLATLSIGLVLAACTLSSDTDLVAGDALATPLPESFAIFAYRQEGDAWVRTDEAALDFRREGDAYLAGDRSMTVRFVPLEAQTYLIAARGAEPGALYGTAWIGGDILAIRMVFDDGLEAAVATLASGLPPDIASDILVTDDGIKVTRRETLDRVIGAIRAHALPMALLVAWIGPDGNAGPPARIIADGEGFRAGD